jgi:hypothetical protein
LVVLAVGGVACGPSFQAVYECDVHFEHCYALDQQSLSLEAKKECWREWLHGYTYGQSRDRVEYAATRFSELSLDPTLPQEEARSAHPRASARSVVAPVPTNAFAPPPNVIDRHAATAPSHPDASTPDASVAPPPSQPVAALAPGASCAGACGQRWTACHDACRESGCDLCDRAYRTCVPGCFREEPSAVRQTPPRSR